MKTLIRLLTLIVCGFGIYAAAVHKTELVAMAKGPQVHRLMPIPFCPPKCTCKDVPYCL